MSQSHPQEVQHAPRTARKNSWLFIWLAAIVLLPLSLFGLVIGSVALLAATQLVATAASLHWRTSPSGRRLLHILGLFVWVIVVPVQLMLAVRFGWSFLPAFLLLGALWLLFPLLPSGWVRDHFPI